jgi:PEP-CTERM motif
MMKSILIEQFPLKHAPRLPARIDLRRVEFGQNCGTDCLVYGGSNMISWLKSVLFAVSLSAVPLTPAFAIQVTLSFTASGFGPGAPTDPVTGSFTYDAASITSNPTLLTAVNLTIDGLAYTLPEVGFDIEGDNALIGGVLNGVDAVESGTNDFFLAWNPATSTPQAFVYATPETSIFASENFPRFSVTAAATPEPSTWAMLMIGFAGLGFAGYRRTRKAA